jgi:hypothetical protein
MAYEYSIDHEQRRVYARMSGPLTIDEVRQLVDELKNDPRVLGGFGELIDLRDASTDSISADDVRYLATAILDASTRRAFVTSDVLTYGLARMFEIYRALHRKPDTSAVFRSRDDAETWLSQG